MWPDNVRSVNVFTVMCDQWLCGPGGPIGLNYASLPEVWRRTKTPPEERDRVFDDIRIMANVALEMMRKK